jgi:predicted nucleotidyltransferase
VHSRIPIDYDRIVEFCQRWKVTEFSLFGSVLREDFRTDSDVDVLVTFTSDAPWSLLDLVTMRDQLGRIFGREVDLVEEAGLRNPFRRHAILSHREVIFAA